MTGYGVIANVHSLPLDPHGSPPRCDLLWSIAYKCTWLSILGRACVVSLALFGFCY